MILPRREFTCPLGRMIGEADVPKRREDILTAIDDRAFALTAKQFATHAVVVGPTGAGKSRLLWGMMRAHRRQRRGFACIDVGDLSNDFLADCAAEVLFSGNTALLKKLHWVKLDPRRLPRYRAWDSTPALEGFHPEMRDFAFQCWRHARTQELLQVYQANTTGSTDFMNQPRAHRVLTNAFTALATQVGMKHLAMEDVFIFFDPTHKDWRRVLDRVAPLLPHEVRQDLELIGGFRRLEDLRREVESSVGRLRKVLGPCMKAMLSATGQEACLDMDAILERGDYLIVDASKTLFVSHEENVALASLLALDLCNAAMNRPRHKRHPFTLFVDETPELLAPLGRELGRWLRILRKYGPVSLVLSFQDIQSMCREDFDLAPTVLGQCGTIICFRNRWIDTDVLARVLLTGNLEFIPLVQEVERHPGHEFIQIDEKSETEKHDKSHGTSNGTSQQETANEVRTHTNSRQGSSSSTEQTAHDPTGAITSRTAATAAVTGSGQADALAQGAAKARGTNHNESDTETRGWAMTINHKIVPLPIVIRELQKTGQLEKAAGDQHEQHRQRLHGLSDRHVIVLAPGMKKAVEIETTEVSDPFASPDAQAKAVDWIVHRLYETHPYFFVPSADPADQERRIQEFLGAEEDKRDDDDEPKPSRKGKASSRRRAIAHEPAADDPIQI